MSDPSLPLDINMDCSELVDPYDLGEKLPFDEEMEVELKEDEFSSTSQFPDSLTPRQPIVKKISVSGGKQGGKRKLTSRRVSIDLNILYGRVKVVRYLLEISSHEIAWIKLELRHGRFCIKIPLE